jgi:tetratricopeptide (TPR) repeat protein
VAVVGLLLAGAGRAEADESEGRRHFKAGQDLYQQKRFLEAAREFEAGYAVAPRPLFLLNIGHAYRRANELIKAKNAYEALLKLQPDLPQRTEVEGYSIDQRRPPGGREPERRAPVASVTAAARAPAHPLDRDRPGPGRPAAPVVSAPEPCRGSRPTSRRRLHRPSPRCRCSASPGSGAHRRRDRRRRGRGGDRLAPEPELPGTICIHE